jgi:hypothetical protein
MLAAAMGGTAAIRCAVVGSTYPAGPRPTENGISMQLISDMGSTISALSAGSADPTIPNRATAAAALTTSRAMSAAPLAASATSLFSVKNAYDSAIGVLQGGTTAFTYSTLATAYGIPTTTTAVTNFRTQMVAAELMILAGAKVVIAVTPFNWDSHGDTAGINVRNMMNTTVLPPLKTFLSRMMPATGRNVTTAIFGDFARSLPGSDHASVLSATVFGKKVQVGTTGKVTSTVGFGTATPGVPGFWSYLAAVAKAPTNPFGANPHPLVLP